ncbi:protein of unknown function DUF1667 [Thermotoga petrophila RKU-10]|jgi:CxxC motif-containing protein|uniref:Molybdopterin oxidoreductase n=1 Tax=Thermotoga petrophila (strain ATCC BAA-489 / DSM 13996 / JCM 10882 / RKU-10) TaxID=590168 RepID=D2C407_THEP2|nr:DUF1667 domain-containing protein [Thermotoga petrophila]ADA67461.1 protein of unknown function DUF1667 [Thermotoga petrophila RKU-10]MBZ4662118.1 hypothetical protein [Thermotoga sp.]MDK2893678.1 hypothetical protein [Thermotoga sp.]MDK2898706.1 hypothetical protein [Thermotoga sp.]
MFKNVVCVQCPIGCKIKVELTEDGHIKSITGNRCPRGVEYAKDEIKDPKRVVPTSIRVLNGELPLASVKTDKPIPKRFIPELMKIVREIKVEAPVKAGDVVLRNLFGTGANLVVTRTVRRLEDGSKEIQKDSAGGSNG